MTNGRAGKGTSASWHLMGGQENVLGAGLVVNKIFELRLSWHLV